MREDLIILIMMISGREEATDINYPNHELYLPENEFGSDAQFDMICRINPLQLVLPDIPLI